MYCKEQELIDLTLLSFFFFLVLGVKPTLIHAKYTLYPVMVLIWRNIYCWVLFLAPTCQLSNCLYFHFQGIWWPFLASLSTTHGYGAQTYVGNVPIHTGLNILKITIWIAPSEPDSSALSGLLSSVTLRKHLPAFPTTLLTWNTLKSIATKEPWSSGRAVSDLTRWAHYYCYYYNMILFFLVQFCIFNKNE